MRILLNVKKGYKAGKGESLMPSVFTPKARWPEKRKKEEPESHET